MIETAEPVEHGDADAVTADVAALGAQLFFDLTRCRVQRILVEPSGRGSFDAIAQLVAVEGLLGSVPLAYDEAVLVDAFVGGEPSPAGQALTAAPDRGAILACP